MQLIRGLLAGMMGGVLLALPVGAVRAEGPVPAPATAPPLQRLNIPGEKEMPRRPELENLIGVKGWQVNGQDVPMSAVYDMALRYHGPYLLQDLITQTLLQQAAKAAGLTVTEAEVSAKVKALRERTGLVEEEPFRRFLQSQRITAEGYRETARMYVYMEKVVGQQVTVKDADIASVYNRERDTTYRRPEAISVKIGGGTDEKAVTAAVAALKKGADFSSVVKVQVATGPESVAGGEVSYWRGQKDRTFPPQLESALFSAPLKQWVGPLRVETPSTKSMGLPPSYVFFRIEGKADAHQFTLEEVQDTIRARLLEAKIDEAFPGWLASQLRDAQITPMKAN